ncbi:hypothetical protein E6O75_ATG05730 [Venturia nashicola]|uniref:Uncharacterized protein n=1 Tax=Venturia nashicola TaxID=86259 RepID=A0A4Z1P0A3_9PEZI|nr:hypothetical protein E6O75_ATG05730 [Venturia nashicola]
MTSIAERRAKLMALAKDDKVMFTPSSKPTPQTTKARLMALAQDDSIMFKPAPKPKAPTNFLSLPREIQQNILYLSQDLDVAYKKDGPLLDDKLLMQYHLLIGSPLM